MQARYLNIEEKHRQFVGNLATLADFSISEADEVDAEIVIRNPAISLYCLDDTTRRAIFVELPPNVDLSPAPFVYQMQYDQAQRLIAMSYDTFREVARQLPQVQKLILVFSCPRSGSTLMSHILNRLDSVLSLSEPDALSQFLHLRPADGSRDAELRDLLDCTVRVLFKPNAFKTPTTYATKFRGEAVQTMDLYHTVFLQAKNLYLYRDAFGFAASFIRLFRQADFPEMVPVDDYIAQMTSIEHYDFTQIVRYLDADTDQLSLPQQSALFWIVMMESYLKQVALGVPVLAVRYADLNTWREQTLSGIFKYCDLPIDQVAQTLAAFEGDSQAGTLLAREKPTEGNALRLTDAEVDEIRTILQRHPVLKTPDFVLPGTLRL